jgi:2TM domain
MYRHETRQRHRDYDDTDEVVGEREAAKRRVRARREFTSNVVGYVVMNAALIGIWALSGTGYFWPGWVIGVWGVILVLHWWNAFGRRPMTEADIDAEMNRRQN